MASTEPLYSPFFGVMGASAAMIFSAMGAAYGTAKSGTGIAAMSVMRPELIMKVWWEQNWLKRFGLMCLSFNTSSPSSPLSWRVSSLSTESSSQSSSLVNSKRSTKATRYTSKAEKHVVLEHTFSWLLTHVAFEHVVSTRFFSIRLGASFTWALVWPSACQV